MLTLPEAILPVLIPFATLFRSPTWRKAQILLVGAVLAPWPAHRGIGAACHGTERRSQLRPLPSRAQPSGMVSPEGVPDPAWIADPLLGSGAMVR